MFVLWYDETAGDFGEKVYGKLTLVTPGKKYVFSLPPKRKTPIIPPVHSFRAIIEGEVTIKRTAPKANPKINFYDMPFLRLVWEDLGWFVVSIECLREGEPGTKETHKVKQEIPLPPTPAIRQDPPPSIPCKKKG